MKVISVLNQKGGVGKTTIVSNLAWGLRKRGHDVGILDTDKQKSITEWAAKGDDTPPTWEATEPDVLEDNLPSLEYDILLIDGAAGVQDMTTPSIKVADLVLIPVQPSTADLWSAQDILKIVEARREVTEGQPDAAFVVSRSKARTRLAKEIKQALDHFPVDALEARTGDRVAYTKALGHGSSVLESGDEKAAREIEALTSEVLSRIQ